VQYADSEKLPFESHTFDAAICGFGVRNFENLKVGLSETYRVLQTNGIVIILEFSTPRNFPIKYLYRFYFHTVVPFLGRLISQDNSAYNYLPESVAVFPDGEKFMNILKEVGFKSLKLKELSFGIATAYIAQK